MPLRWTLIAGMAALALLPTGCERRQPQERPERNVFGQQELLIGLMPERNIFRQRERYQALGSYLSGRLGITVNFTSLTRYGNIVQRLSEEKLDGAFFGSFTYALAHSTMGMEAVARPVNVDGTSTYHGYLFARKDSGIRTVADMKGKRFAYVDRATTAGYLFPRAYLKEKGVADPDRYFGEVFFAGSHDAAVLAVLNGEADIGAAKNTVYDQLARENARVDKELLILAASAVVPQNGLAVRKDLDPELKKALKQALLDMDKDRDGLEALRQLGARGFVETLDKDYAYVYALAAEVGLNLRSYRYMNR